MHDKIPSTVRWLGYDFGVYEHGPHWSEAGGIYIFSRLDSEGG